MTRTPTSVTPQYLQKNYMPLGQTMAVAVAMGASVRAEEEVEAAIDRKIVTGPVITVY